MAMTVIAHWREVTVAATIATMEYGSTPKAAADKGRARAETATAAERRRYGTEASASTATPKCRHAAAAKSAAASAMKGVTAASATAAETSSATTAASTAMLDLCEQSVMSLLCRGCRAGIDQRDGPCRWRQRHHHRCGGSHAERARHEWSDRKTSFGIRDRLSILNMSHRKHPPSISAWDIDRANLTAQVLACANGAFAHGRVMWVVAP
jgi:hypothetical protein